MESEIKAILASVFMVAVCLFLLGWGLFDAGVIAGVRNTRQAAIDAGVAVWTVDEKTGETTFVFKGPTNGKQ